MAHSRGRLLAADELYARAVTALARRSRSVAELKRLLRRVASSEQQLQLAVERLKDHGYLSDSRFAEHHATFQRDAEKHGRMRVLRDLRARGVHPQLAEAAVRASFSETDETEQIREFLKKKRIGRPDSLRAAANLHRRLLHAGFTPAASLACLRQWKLDGEWLEMLESAGEPADGRDSES